MPERAEPVAAADATDLRQTARVSFKNSEASVLLDLVRGLAALLVVGEHWRNLLFVDYRDLQQHKGLWMVPYLLTGAGHQAVIVFFVLSGYLISGTIFRAVQDKTWSWKLYLTHRLLRLWIVLLPGLLLCALWDRLGIHLGRAPLVYAGADNNFIMHDVASQLTLRVFFDNLFFLQGVPYFGSDVSLWSLPYEAWYYVAFPLAWLLWVRYGSWRMRLLHAVVLMAILYGMGAGEMWLFPIWLGGAVLVKLPPLRLRTRVRGAAVCAYLPLLFAFSKTYHIRPILRDSVLGVATVLLLWVLLSARDRADESVPLVRFSRGMARFSFTLYVAHMPVLALLTSLVAGDARWYPHVGYVAKGLGILAAVLVYAWAVAWLSEFRTDGVRRWVEARLRLTPAAPAQPQAVQ
jgi:peptidoglycan/LPS O-acetylase OafA/YrhL